MEGINNCKKVLIILMISMVVFSMGCLQLQEKKIAVELSADDILTKSKSNMETLSYEFSGEIRKTNSETVKLPFSGKVSGEKGYIIFHVENETIEIYQKGDMVYTQYGEEGPWTKNMIKGDESFIESEAKLVGQEKVEGEDCWIVEFKPRIEGELIAPQYLENFLEEIQATGKYWITNDYRIKKEELNALGASNAELVIITKINFKSVEIKLPKDAENAKFDIGGFLSLLPIQYSSPISLGLLSTWQMGLLA